MYSYAKCLSLTLTVTCIANQDNNTVLVLVFFPGEKEYQWKMEKNIYGKETENNS